MFSILAIINWVFGCLGFPNFIIIKLSN